MVVVSNNQPEKHQSYLGNINIKDILAFVPASGMSFERHAVISPVVIDAVNIESMTVPNRIHIMAINRPLTVFGHKSPYL